MRYGRGAAPKGMLPVYSVGSEDEAKRLIAMTCSVNYDGEYVAKELAAEQTLEHLQEFGNRLKAMHDKYLSGKDCCTCGLEFNVEDNGERQRIRAPAIRRKKE